MAAKAEAEGKAAYQAERWEEAYRKLEVAAKLQRDDAELGKLISSAREHHRDALIVDAKAAESKPDLERFALLLAQAFDVLPGKELEMQLRAARYAAGKKASKESRFREAHLFLKDIHDFEDASQLDDKAKMELDIADGISLLEQAKNALEAGDYNTAYTQIEDATRKLSSAPPGRAVPLERLKELRDRVRPELYRMGIAAVQRESLEEAAAIFKRLGDYNDSAARLSAIEARQAEVRRKREEAEARKRAELAATANAADHIADFHLIQEGGKLLIQFKVATAKGDYLAIPGKVTVSCISAKWVTGHLNISKNKSVETGGYEYEEKTLVDNVTVNPEQLVDGLGRERVGYRLDALPWHDRSGHVSVGTMSGACRVRLVFTVSGTTKSLEAKAQDTD